MILEKAKKYRTTSDKEEKRLQSIMGRALAIRAHSNFLLINLFAKQYDKSTAYNDVGIPYLYKYEGRAIVKYKRETVGKVYDSIEADLLKATKLIDDRYIKSGHFNFNSYSTNALLCRFYLYKKEWGKSIKYADIVLKTRKKLLDIKRLSKKYALEPHGFVAQYFHPNKESILVLSKYTSNLMGVSHFGYYPFPIRSFLKKMKIYDADSYFSSPNFVLSYLIVAKKHHENQASRVGLYTVEELYYNKAEASIGKGDLKTAKELLLVLIESDIYTGSSLTEMKNRITKASSKQELLNVLLIAKRVRFFAEGMRWFDIKRHRLPVKHKTPTGFSEIKGGNPEEYVIQPPLEEFDFGGI